MGKGQEQGNKRQCEIPEYAIQDACHCIPYKTVSQILTALGQCMLN